MRKAPHIAAMLLALSVATAAQPASARITRGDAEAIFQSFPGAGWAIELHNDGSEGNPADFRATDGVRIATDAASNGRHYCVLDWQAIAVGIIEGRRAGETLFNQDIFDRLEARMLTFKLDGALLETTATQPRRMLNPGLRSFEEAFYVVVGRVIAPGEISIGQHTSQSFNPAGTSTGLITFYIDAPGTGVCGADDALTFRDVE